MRLSFKLLMLLVFTGFYFAVNGQIPTPAKDQEQPIALVGGTIHTGNGEVIENGMIRFEEGKITVVIAGGESLPDDNVKVIDVTGKHVYPGIIAPNTSLGLIEIDAVRATRDYAEVGKYNPNVRSIIAYNTDSRIIPTVRSNGILLAQITPRSGLISGSSTIVELDAWNWEDAAYKTDLGIHLHWPSTFTQKGWWGNPGGIEKNKQYDETVSELYDYFSEAKAYAVQEPDQLNQRFESMKGLFDRNKKLFIHATLATEILAVVDFKKEFNLDVVLVGGRESWQVAEFLKENEIPVILAPVHSLPQRQDEDIDIVWKTPFLLKQAGVDFCLQASGSWEQRNLMFMSGNTVAYGLSKEEALEAITLSAAKILGISETVGSLEKGKDATLIVSSGDILDMRTSNVEMAFIRGKVIDLGNKQKTLYRKFQEKYNNQ